jgi:hypothetical protein
MVRQLTSSAAGQFDDWTVGGMTAHLLDGLPPMVQWSMVDGLTALAV